MRSQLSLVVLLLDQGRCGHAIHSAQFNRQPHGSTKVPSQRISHLADCRSFGERLDGHTHSEAEVIFFKKFALMHKLLRKSTNRDQAGQPRPVSIKGAKRFFNGF